MSFGGGHLGYPIGIKNTHLVEDLPMIIPGQFGFNYFNIGPYGENVSKRFSEITWIIETKLPRNDHWKVLYKVCVFYGDRISKMATTEGHRLALDPMGKCIGSNVNLCIVVAAILDFRST
jgi:hypothetical protein